MKTNYLFSSIAAACFTCGVLHAADGKVIPADFATMGEQTASAVKSIKPTKATLTADDQELLMKIAKGGMKQLEASKVAAKMAATQDVRVIAEAEVSEQTGLAMKLKEIAMAKSITLPTTLDEKCQKEIADLSKKDGENLDTHYIKEIGVAGHKELKETMEKVDEKATDPDLKSLSAATMPLIKLHLKVAQAEEKEG